MCNGETFDEGDGGIEDFPSGKEERGFGVEEMNSSDESCCLTYPGIRGFFLTNGFWKLVGGRAGTLDPSVIYFCS